ncbi:MAG: YihY/virulence factor BrkB family protein [Anaerolineales bacterium]|nr:YihY/virulence factor BrkB family protein [Anaerolineales bacterium]
MLVYLKSRIMGSIRFIRRVIASFGEHGSVRHAAALSYYTLFSLFPLMLFLVYIASFFFPSEASRQQLAAYLEGFFPVGANNLENILEQTWQARGSIGIVGGLGLMWGGSSIFTIMEISLSRIFDSSPRDFWRRRLLGALSVLAIVVTFLASFSIGPITNLLLESTGGGRWITAYLMELTTLTLIMTIIFRVYPNEHVYWGAAFAGAFSSAILLMIAKFGFRLYTSSVLNRSGLLYGSVTWFMTLALWIYLVGVLILFGAEFAAAFQYRQKVLAQNKKQPQ